jgi:multiple antibiotic resistance protein
MGPILPPSEASGLPVTLQVFGSFDPFRAISGKTGASGERTRKQQTYLGMAPRAKSAEQKCRHPARSRYKSRSERMHPISDFVTSFMIGYTTLLAIVNPLGIAFVFHGMSRWVTPSERAWLSRQISLYAFAILIGSMYFGTYILNFFGISLEALRIAGGISVALAGWFMLNEPAENAQSGKLTAIDTAPVAEMAFYPLTLPLTTGPGAITASIALAANHAQNRLVMPLMSELLVAAAVAITVFVCYRWSNNISRVVGPAGSDIITRLSAFLLLCVGTQITMTGLVGALQLR